MNKILINFLLGGAIVSATSYLGAYTTPLIAALFWAYPFSLFPSIHFLKEIKKKHLFQFITMKTRTMVSIGF